MDPPPKPTSSLFEVYLRLRPSRTANTERFLDVEEAAETDSFQAPTHITIRPPASDNRKRAVERFAFTRVFQENAAQLDLFDGTGILPLLEGAIGAEGREGRDGLLATLGVTGSGKSHTILGTKTQRGLTQMTLDTLFASVEDLLVHVETEPAVYPSLAASDVSESQLIPASSFLDMMYGDGVSERGYSSRAQTPMPVGSSFLSPLPRENDSRRMGLYPTLPSPRSGQTAKTKYSHMPGEFPGSPPPISPTKNGPKLGLGKFTRNVQAKLKISSKDGPSFISTTRRAIPRPSAMPISPSMGHIDIHADRTAQFAIVVSMYEVYNDRIFDLLGGSLTAGKVAAAKRRALLFKSTEHSPDRKVVAGLRKIICGSLEEALTVLETGLIERKVAGTGSNAVSSRSHGFFCVEIKKRDRATKGPWSTSTLTIVDLAGSERARNAKTAGATLAEAGKINESLMYLGQCMQMQSDNQEGGMHNIVPYRQCKLTELLFSNSFPSATPAHHHHHHRSHRAPQKAIMIVTADPLGDFNATSQILRYSALAREVTVPRIPSVTSTILSGTLTANPNRPGSSGRTTPASATAALEELEAASQTASRLADELEVLTVRLAEETERRQLAEASWRAAEERMEQLEQDVRDECWAEMEVRMEEERRRWAGAWVEEADRADERVDRKIEIMGRLEASAGDDAVQVHEDPEPTALERLKELEMENESMKRKLHGMEADGASRSPSKKQKVLKARKWEVDVGVATP